MIKFDDLGPATQEALAKCTEGQREFIRHLIENGGNQSAAYRAAFPEAKGPSASAVDLMKKPHIKMVIEDIRLAAAREFRVDEKRILEAYAHLAFADIRDFFREDGSLVPIRELPRHLANMVLSFDTDEINVGSGENRQVIGTTHKVRLINRKEALDSLARTQGLFVAPDKKGNENSAKVVRLPAPIGKSEWQKKHG